MRYLLSLLFIFSSSSYAVENMAEEVLEQIPAQETPVQTEELSLVTEDKVAVTTETEKRKESEIPLNLETNKKAATEDAGVFRILMTLSILGVVGTGAFFFLRKYKIPRAMKHQTPIKVLQQHYLGPKKSLAIVRVAGESILIGVTDHNISMIKSLSLMDDEVPEEAPQNFDRVLGDSDAQDLVFQESTDEVARTGASRRNKARELDIDEEFAISGIKDIVSKRLKGMRSIQ